MRRAALKNDIVYCIVKSIATVNRCLSFFRSVPCLIAVALDRIRAQRILSLDIPGPGLSLFVVSGKGKIDISTPDHPFGSPWVVHQDLSGKR